MKYIKLRIWWSDKKKKKKIAYVISSIAAYVALVFLVLQLAGVWDYGWAVMLPCWVVAGLANAVENWNTHRKSAISHLCVVAVMIVFVIVIMLIPD